MENQTLGIWADLRSMEWGWLARVELLRSSPVILPRGQKHSLEFANPAAQQDVGYDKTLASQ